MKNPTSSDSPEKAKFFAKGKKKIACVRFAPTRLNLVAGIGKQKKRYLHDLYSMQIKQY